MNHAPRVGLDAGERAAQVYEAMHKMGAWLLEATVYESCEGLTDEATARQVAFRAGVSFRTWANMAGVDVDRQPVPSGDVERPEEPQ